MYEELFEAIFGGDDVPIASFPSIVGRPHHQASGGRSAGAAVDVKSGQSLSELLAVETHQSGLSGQVSNRLREVIAASAPTGDCDPDIGLVCSLCALPFQSIYGLEKHRCRAPNTLVLEVNSGQDDSLCSKGSSVSTKRRVAGRSKSIAKSNSKKQKIKEPQQHAKTKSLLKPSNTADSCDPFGIPLTIRRFTAKSRVKQGSAAISSVGHSSKPCVKPNAEKINNPEELTPQDLAVIFKHHKPKPSALELKEPTALEIARLPWDTVEHLNLPFLGPKLATIVKQCPNLQTVVARKSVFWSGSFHCLASSAKLSRIKLYDCFFAFCSHSSLDFFNQLLSGNFSDSVTLEELVLCNAHFSTRYSNVQIWSCSVDRLPVSLKRLQLSGLKGDAPSSIRDLEHLQQLECLIVTPLAAGARRHGGDTCVGYVVYHTLVGRLRNLTELCLSRVFLYSYESLLDLPKLAVLFVGNLSCSAVCLRDLIAARAALRILVITGKLTLLRHPGGDAEASKQITPRCQDASAADSPPLLHIFLGEQIATPVQFAQLPADVIVRRVDGPLAKFLEREDITPIFRNVWIAEQIKEAAKLGSPFAI